MCTGKTERIELRSFYPLLALFFELGVGDDERPIPPALTHKIVKGPTPKAPAIKLEDGTVAQIVSYGDEIPFDPGAPAWWPTSPSSKAHYKLFHRIYREGYLLPNYFAICLALLAKIYTTTSVSASDSPSGVAESRIRITAYGSPLADFGIAKGVVLITPTARLAYHNSKDGTFYNGQDPYDHYWLYFRTIRGEEYTLDCGMYAFNHTEGILNTKTYLEDLGLDIGFRELPAAWRGKTAKLLPQRHFAEKRLSFLQDWRLWGVIEEQGLDFGPRNLAATSLIMNEIAGKTVDIWEKVYALRMARDNITILTTVLTNKCWMKWPEYPVTGFHNDPEGGESLPGNTPEDAEFFGTLVKQLNKGKISKEQLVEQYQAFVRRSRTTK